MNIIAIRTNKVTAQKETIEEFLSRHIKEIPDKIILAVTSKVISILENNVIPVSSVDKKELIKKEAQFYSPKLTQYNMVLTINRNMLIPTAGIDESNGNGFYILWPEDPQKSANRIRRYLVKRFKKQNIGVIITDSKTTPLRWGTTGFCLAHSGFSALNNYIGTKDIFGRTLVYTKANIADALACASVVVMGEGSEQTPLAIISDIPFVYFQKRNPSKKELKGLHIDIKDDLYADLLTNVNWVSKRSKGETK